MPKLVKYITSLSFLSIILFSSCKDNDVKTDTDQKLKQLDWMLGTWKGTFNTNTIVEVWNKKKEHAFEGNSYYIINDDTNHIESLRLEIIENEVYYSADVPQNKSIVSFLMVKSDKNTVTFENKHHDFPSVITYELIDKNTLKATISGVPKGEYKEDSFVYKKSLE